MTGHKLDPIYDSISSSVTRVCAYIYIYIYIYIYLCRLRRRRRVMRQRRSSRGRMRIQLRGGLGLVVGAQRDE